MKLLVMDMIGGLTRDVIQENVMNHNYFILGVLDNFLCIFFC